MKLKIVILISLLSFSCIGLAQLESRISEPFELTSIVFRLAGAKEYISNDIPCYANDINNYFASYKTHKIIDFVKSLRENYQIGYDAVANAAALIEIKNRKVKIKNGTDAETINKYDHRWSPSLFKTFVTLLDHFYKKTKFDQFFLQHTELYNIAQERMNKLLCEVDTQWFDIFFGEKLNARIVLSLCNGPKNYAFALNSNNFGIVIGTGCDKEGLPFYGKRIIYTLLHELSHGFTNKRVDYVWNQIDSSAHTIYPYVQQKMYNNAYGSPKVVINEWLTNLFTLMYFRENPIDIPYKYFIIPYMSKGFIWLERSDKFMDYFYENRKKFRTIDDYMPQIAGHINFIADHFEDILKEYENRHPYIVDIFPASYTSEIDTIKIKFSESMKGSHGMKPLDDKSILYLPYLNMPFWKDEFTYTIIIDKSKLTKGETYGFRLHSQFFQSKRNFPLKEDFIYTFNISEL